ncbi:hemagglutinin [Tianweitania populi]|uniref:Hemagglutinin n=1 Tax=Tianweitania populi TaxID=1607949 RepID=A0A8J3GLV1_9HYPH|nr:hemagglutinin [Tianweitania populi]
MGGSVTVPLSTGSNVFPVVVTAQNGITTKTYKIQVTRRSGSKATLDTLELSGVSLSTSFQPGRRWYDANADEGVTSTSITATTTDPTDTIRINDVLVESGASSQPISLKLGQTQIIVWVITSTGAGSGYTINVERVAPKLTISPSSGALKDAASGSPYAEDITAIGGSGDYIFTISSGALPAGLMLSQTGSIEGSPTEYGDFKFTVTVTERSASDEGPLPASADYTLTVSKPDLQLLTGDGSGMVGRPFNLALEATGGTRPYKISVSSGALPTGLTSSGLNISGIPTGGGTYDLTLMVTDGTRSPAPLTATKPIKLVIAPPTLSVAPTILSIDAGAQLSEQLYANQGTLPYSFAPLGEWAGFTLSPDGTLSGTQRKSGEYPLKYRVTDSSTGSGPYSFEETLTITVRSPRIQLDPLYLPKMTVGANFSQVFSATGGTSPYAYAISDGQLPDGIKLNEDALAGTPSKAGFFRFAITAIDADGNTSDPRTYDVTVNAPTIVLSPTTLSGAKIGLPFEEPLSANGGLPPYSFRVTNGSLPLGISLSAEGALSGTPTQGGLASFSITATDSSTGRGAPFSGTQEYSLVVGGATLSISPTSLPNGLGGNAYSQQLTASGGTKPYTFSAGTGLPRGLALDVDGTLSGTPIESGTFSFAVTVTDDSSGAGPYRIVQDYVLVIDAPGIGLFPQALADAKAASEFSQVFTASGGTEPYAFTLSGTLPTGLAFSKDRLSGIPTEEGAFLITVTATDGYGFQALQNYTLAVAPPTIALNPSTLPKGSGGTAYLTILTASGGFSPYTFAVDGNVPPGLALGTDGKLSGVPTSAGSFTFTVTATDDETFTGSQLYTVDIEAPGITVIPRTLPAAVVASAYNEPLEATGGTAPYTFAISAGALPEGLTLESDGFLTGTPTDAGAFSLTIRALDVNGFAGTQAYTLDVSAPTIVLAPGSLPAVTGSALYRETITASGGLGNYSFKVTSGALPTGLALAPDGTLSGVPTAAGGFNFTVTATDSGTFTGFQAYTVTVAAPGIALAPSNLPDAVVAAQFSQTLSASGGAAPYTFALASGSLPAGVTLASDGTLRGAPTEAGSFVLTVSATDANGFAGSQAFTLDVSAPAIILAPGSLPSATGSAAYAQTISASGGLAPYSFTVTAGTLPQGLALAANGVLSGTPTVSGSFAFTVTATDHGNFTASQAYTLRVDAPQVAVTPASLSNATAGNAYAITFAASGGAAPYSFAVSGGELPTGLVFDTGGRLSGTPQTGGSFAFTIEATDANGFAATVDLSLTVDGEIPVAQNQSAALLAGTTSTVRLTDGARGGPFTNATLVSVSDPSLGTSRIVRSGSDYDLVFAAGADASGQTVATYTLSNQFATSAPASVTFMVTARPNPSKDAEVIGLVSAQVESTQRMARAQIRNFRDRLEQTHDEETRLQGSFGITLGGGRSEDDRPLSSYAEEEARRGTDPATLAVLGYANDSKPIVLPSEAEARRRFGNAALWTGGFVNFGSRDNDGIELDQTLVGISAGVDYRFSSQFVGGVGFGVGRDKSEIGDRGSQASARAYSGAVYGSYSPVANIYVDGVLGYSDLNFDTRRAVTDQDLRAQGERSGNQVFGSLTVAYEHKQNGWLVAPYAGYEGSRSNLDAYSENGAGIFNLRFGEQQVTTSSALIGLRLEKDINRLWGTLTPKGRIEYSHDFDGSSRVGLGYADLGDNLPYSLDADVFSKDNITLVLGIDAQFATGWALGLTYKTEFGTNGNAQDHRIEAKVSKRF